MILNRVASARHLALIAPAFERIKLPVFDAVLRDERIALPERLLGLVQAQEIGAIDQHVDRLADVVDAAVDVDAIRRSARSAKVSPATGDERSNESKHHFPPPGQRIALAQDRAFSFMYPHLLRSWRRSGDLARQSFRSRRWQMRPPMTAPTRSGCREAIRNFMPALWRRRIIFAEVSAHWPNVPFPSTVSAGAIWC